MTVRTLITILLLPACGALAVETNVIYVPLESGVPLSDAVRGRTYERQLELAKNLPESRPAELDPEGNWGAVASGLQLKP